jgi:hypothetical protein
MNVVKVHGGRIWVEFGRRWIWKHVLLHAARQ